MRRHADSISERNNVFTNLTDTGRVGVHRRSRQDTLEGRAGLSRTDLQEDRLVVFTGVFASPATVVLM